jgi:AcrR family transcriptional regulator
VKESNIPKATFYNYFHSKERFIEICLIVQKERLKEKVVSIAEYTSHTSTRDKLKELYLLHTDLEGLYYLLFKAIFEIKLSYPKAYQVAIKYRTWLINEIYSQLRALKTDTTFQDAKLFLYMIEGAIIQLLDSNQVDEREKVLECFLVGFV